MRAYPRNPRLDFCRSRSVVRENSSVFLDRDPTPHKKPPGVMPFFVYCFRVFRVFRGLSPFRIIRLAPLRQADPNAPNWLVKMTLNKLNLPQFPAPNPLRQFAIWTRVLIAAIALICGATNAARAELPSIRIDRISPLGAGAGTTVEVEVIGRDIEDVNTL